MEWNDEREKKPLSREFFLLGFDVPIEELTTSEAASFRYVVYDMYLLSFVLSWDFHYRFRFTWFLVLIS